MTQSQQGLSLLESLIAMFIMSVGLLGVLALQTQSLTHQRSAYLETQATHLAQDMLDRLRANKAQASAYALTLGQPRSGSGLAAADTAEWVADLAEVLPGGKGAITIALPRVSVTVAFEDTSTAGGQRRIQLVSEL